MADALVRTDLDLALDVLGHVAAQVAFNLEVGVDPRSELGHFLVREVTYPGVPIDPGGRAHLV